MSASQLDSHSGHTTKAWSELYGSPQLMEAMAKEIYRSQSPLVVTGDSQEVISRFIDTKLLPRLRANKEHGEIVEFSPQGKGGVLTSLSKALTEMFQGLTLQLLHSVRTQEWAPLLRSLVRQESAPGGQRILVVLNFDQVFDAPIGEQELFTHAIGKIAQEKGITVIVGVTEENIGRAAQLPGMTNPKRDGGCLSLSTAQWFPRRNLWQKLEYQVREFSKDLKGNLQKIPNQVKAVPPMRWAMGGAVAVFGCLVVAAVALFVVKASSGPEGLEEFTEDIPLLPAIAKVEKPQEVAPPVAEVPVVDDNFEEIDVVETGSRKVSPPPNLIPVTRDSIEKAPSEQ